MSRAPNVAAGLSEASAEAPAVEASAGGMSRDAILAGMKDIEEQAAKEEAEETPREETPEESDTSPSSDDGDEEADSDEDDEDSSKDGDDESEPADDEDESPIDSKKLEALHAKEKKIKEAQDKREFELETKERAVLAKQQELESQLKNYEAAKSRALIDPVAFLEELGVFEDPEDYEHFARESFSKSPKGQKSAPGTRMQARNEHKRREAASKLERAEARLQELEQKIVQKENQAEQEKFVTNVSDQISEETPLSLNYLKQDPDEAREKIFSIGVNLFRETGEPPDAVDVIKVLEKQQMSLLKKLGIDPDVVRKKSGTKKQNPEAEEKESVKTKTLSNLSNPTSPKGAPLRGNELRSHVLSNMPFGE